MEPEENDNDIKQELKELLESYDVDVMDSPFKEWFQRAIEQEKSVGWGAFKSHEEGSLKEANLNQGESIVDKQRTYKVGDLVKRKSTVIEGAIGIVTRVDSVTTSDYHGNKYLVTFQYNGQQLWLNEDQLVPVA